MISVEVYVIHIIRYNSPASLMSHVLCFVCFYRHEVNAARRERSDPHPAGTPADGGRKRCEMFAFLSLCLSRTQTPCFSSSLRLKTGEEICRSGKSYHPMNAEGERPDRLLLSLLFHLFTLGPYQARHANTAVQIRHCHN